MVEPNKGVPKVTVSVRDLAGQTSRDGGLSPHAFFGISSAEGTRLHQRVFDDLTSSLERDEHLETEMTLSATYQDKHMHLLVRGRADAVIISQTQTILLEIKSWSGDKNSRNMSFCATHWAQVMLYAHMFFDSNPHIEEITVKLRYVSIVDLSYLDDTRIIMRKDASDIFNRACATYLCHYKKIYDKKLLTADSIRTLSFPYELIRTGQKDMMKHVVRTLSDHGALFVEAPTGIGKTMATLFAAVKSLARGTCEKIFYLTAKTSTRYVALQALNDMRQAGLYIRSITLQAKKSLCPVPQHYCDTKICIYATHYYDNLSAAKDELMSKTHLSPEDMLAAAKRHLVCPHELSLDMSLYCDVIIGDYNHVFHPRVRLERYFDELPQQHALLIDEAHNLVDRSRDMYSASLSLKLADYVVGALTSLDGKADAAMRDMISYLKKMQSHLGSENMAIPLCEKDIDTSDCMRTGSFEASRKPPKTLYLILWRFCHFTRPLLDNLPQSDIKRDILTFYFDVRFFVSVLEQYFDENYIVAAKLTDDQDLSITLMCLDASRHIKQAIVDKNSAIFFSATLSPIDYYTKLLMHDTPGDYLHALQLTSPFDPDNLSLGIYTHLRTTFKERPYTADAICRGLLKLLAKRKGHYMIYLPSFSYLKLFSAYFSDALKHWPTTDLLVQSPSMNDAEKKAFIDRFSTCGEHSLIGLAVLGGHFGEGIDLLGDCLNGVVIVGVGLPSLSPERDILSQYYQDRFSQGFAFAYRYPGWERVLQAAGRVIRSDDDKGFVLLVDHRYDRPEYRLLFPKHWHPIYIENMEHDDWIK